MKLFRRREEAPEPPPRRDGPLGFGYKGAWLALRTDAPAAVSDALGLVEVREASWPEGIEPAPSAVFLTPPVDGWTLAVLGRDFFEDDGDGALDLAALSRRFGEVQKFASHRVVEYHEWQRWLDGSPVRRYAFLGESGEVVMDEGERRGADAEVATGAELDGGDWDDLAFADEDVVMAVAAEWSVDPTTPDERDDLPPQGLLGRAR